MIFKLTDDILQDIILRAQQQGELIQRPMDLGRQSYLPQRLGTGGIREIKLRHGLCIQTYHGQLWQDTHWMREHGSHFPLVSKIYLSGGARMRAPTSPDVDSDYEEIKGHHYLYHLPNQTEIEEWRGEEWAHVICLFADPGYFSSFDTSQTILPPILRKLIAGDRSQRFHQPLGAMTSKIKQLAKQILHCPYTGLMQQIYLESKVLELFAAQFSLWAEPPAPSSSISLCAQDIKQLHQAKEILIQQAEHPPSLTELAQQVKLNDRKLKEGFRHVFGTTAFGYLRNYRLQQAKDLLHDSNLTIASVAMQVGYKSPEAFCNAFRRKFSVSPKAYQLGQRS